MAESINIPLLDIYRDIAPEDIQTGKNFVLRRESAANGLASLIDALLADAAEKIVRICYRYGVNPTTFTFTPQYNGKMFEEVAQVLNELEDELLDLIESYAMKCTEGDDKKKWLLLFILSLGRNGKGLQKSLDDRLWVFSRDLEAMIAASKLAKMDVARAVSVIRSNLHTAYNMPGMKSAFKNASQFQATYIRTRGVKKGNMGNSNSEANNIVRFGKMTVQMAWMKYHYQEYKNNGAAGYYVLRGSTYPCSLCDSFVGFHAINDVDSYPPYHAHCCCYTVPVFKI